ncbi:ABC transporter permease [Proteinivorax hydrogeniformans]|uniref:ABC transporter permease n=1 Tax=Proteinivorax hydrogeniformans TaxID=1826727 RepID=A0AAU8HPC6_9FIRM
MSNNLKSTLITLGFAFIAIFVALVIGGILIQFTTEATVIEAYTALYNDAFGDLRSILNTLWRSTPLILTGLAVAFAFKCGLFNIGAEGQLLIGGFVAGVAGYAITGLPAVIHVTLCIALAMLAGGIWGGIPGILKAKLGVNEVINTIMLNLIALQITVRYGIQQLRLEGAADNTPRIEETAELTRFTDTFINDIFDLPGGVRVHTGLVLALLAAVFVWYLLFKTRTGYEIRAVGINPSGAEYGGINVAKNIFLVMFISGALAGLGGAVEVLGTHRYFTSGLDAGLGFTGIAVALLGNNNPGGVILAGILFGALTQGGMGMQFAGVPREIVTIIQALVIFFMASLQMFKIFIDKRRAKEVAK